MNSQTAESVGYFGCLIILIPAILVGTGVACTAGFKRVYDNAWANAGGGVYDGAYAKYRAKHPRSQPRSVGKTGKRPASDKSMGKRCVGNPYAAPASHQFGVPLALIQCVHYAESRCRTDESVQGKYTAWSAVSGLAKPTKQRHAIRQIADDLGVADSDIRSNRIGAMGPFQFIPTTWVSNGIDADGDGRVNPYDLADSTYGAANMLAKVKARKGSWRAAIKRYNAKPAYIERVASCAGI